MTARRRRGPTRRPPARTRSPRPSARVSAGRVGTRAGRHPWWTPVRVLLALAAVVVALGMLQKAPCYSDTWSDSDARFSQMCYSDLPYLYTGRALVERAWPYSGDDDAARALPRGHGVPRRDLLLGLGHRAGRAGTDRGLPAARPRRARRRPTRARCSATSRCSARSAPSSSSTRSASRVLTLLAVWLLARTHPRRPWDALWFARLPGAAADRPGQLGPAGRGAGRRRAVGLGDRSSAADRRAHRSRHRHQAVPAVPARGGAGDLPARAPLARAGPGRGCGAGVAWLLANLPAMLTGYEQWRVFWSFNSERGADLGSLWLVAAQAGDLDIAPSTINTASLALLRRLVRRRLRARHAGAPRPRAWPSSASCWSPASCWSTRSTRRSTCCGCCRWRCWPDPACATSSCGRPARSSTSPAVWWYLGGLLDAGGGGDAGFYWVAIVLRVAAELYLVALVVRDVWRPRHDPVRRTQPVRARLR